MVGRASQRIFTSRIVLYAFTAFIALTACNRADAQTRGLSQTRINEYAATLLRAHRVLIEIPGLRQNGEQLSPYMHRIAAPLPGELETSYLSRTEGYITELERILDRRSLCVTMPQLSDSRPQNVAIWRKAAAASAQLPGRLARLRAAWAAARSRSERPAACDRLAVELNHILIDIKTAFEALRDARP